MAENTVFRAGLEIVPKFDRNKVSTLLKSISQQMNVESKKLSDAIKIGVKIDTTAFMNATSQYAKTIESIGKALDEENKKGFNGKNTRLFSIMEQAKTTREEVGKVFSEYNKMIKATAKPSNLSQDTSVKLGGLQNAISLPDYDYKQVKTKIKSIKDSVKELENLKGEVGLSDKQVVQVEKALIRADKTLYKLQNSFTSLSRVKLLNFVPKTAQQANMAMSELKSRQQQLNISTKTGAKAYNEMEEKIRQLHVAKTKLTNSSRSEMQAIDGVTQATYKQNAALHQLKILARQYLGVYAVARVAQNIRDITGEFELQRVALGAIIQDQHKANQLFEEAKAQALESPFQVKDVVTYMKQLSAFQIDKNEIAETTKRLADISAGLGVDMSRIILAYGQVRAASVLRGQELRQFTEAGIPLVEKLAQKFTLLNGKLVTTSDVFGLISERKVPFEMVRDVMWEMTEAGGAFFDMQKKQAQTIKGSYSNLQDEIQVAYDKIGQANYGVIKGSIDTLRQIIRLGSDNISMIAGLGTAFLTAKAGMLIYNKALTEQGVRLMANLKLKQKIAAQEAAISNIGAPKSQRASTSISRSPKISKGLMEELYINDKISKAELNRLFVYGKLSKSAAEYAYQEKLISKTLYERVALLQANAHSTNLLTAANARARLGLIGLRVAFSNSMIAMKSFALSLINPITGIFAAISVISTLVMKYKEGQKAAEEFSKKIKEDVIYKLEEFNKVIKEMPTELINIEVKIKTNKETLEEEYAKLNSYLLDGMKGDEILLSLSKERIKLINSEKGKYEALIEIQKDYENGLLLLKSNPMSIKESMPKTEWGFGGIFGSAIPNLIDFRYDKSMEKDLSALSESYNEVLYIVKTLSETEYEGSKKLNEDIKDMQDRGMSIKSILDTIENYKGFNRLINSSNKFKSSWRDVNSEFQKSNDSFITFLLNLNKTIPAVDGIKIDLSKYNFGVTPQKAEKVRTILSAMFANTFKDADEGFKTMIDNFSKNTIKVRVKPYIDNKNLTTFSENVNDFNVLAKSKIKNINTGLLIPQAPENQSWGYAEINKYYEEEWKKVVEDRKTLEAAVNKGNTEWSQKLKNIETKAKELKPIADLAGVDTEVKEKKTKGKTALELVVERIKSDIDNIKELKKRYDELIKYSSNATAQEEALSLFMGLDGKSSLPKEMQKGYSDEAYMDYLENIKKDLKKKFKGAKKGVEISKINAEIKKIDIEIRDVKVENLKRVSDKILQDVQDELNNTKARVDLFEDMFKTTGDYNLSKNLTDMIEGAGNMDMLGGFKDNLNKVIEGAFSSDKDIDLLKNLKLDINNAAVFTDFDKIMEELPEPAQKAFETILNNYKDTSKNIIKDVLSSVEKYKDAELQKVEITAKTRKQIEEIQKLSIDKEEKDRLISISKQGEREQIAKIELQQLKESEWYTQMFSNLETTSRDVLEMVREKLVSIKELNKGALDPTQMKELVSQIEKIDKILLPTKYSWKDAFIPNTEEITNAKELVTTLEKQKEELELDKFEAQLRLNNPDITEEEKIAVSQKEIEIATKLTNLNNQLNVSTQDYINKVNKQKEAVKTFNDQVEQLGNTLSKMQGLTGDVTSFMQGLMKVFKGKENEEFAKVMQEINDTITIAQSAYSILQTVMTTFFTIEKVGEATTISLNTAMLANPAFWVVAGIMALVGALKLYQAIADKAANREIENMNTALENSERIIKDMENALSNLAGNEYFQNIASQIDEMEKRASYAQRQLDAERSKTKPDEDKVKEYTESVEKYTQAARDKQRELIESLWGDLKSMTEDLINVWLDAYKSGANTFNAIKKKFGEMIEDMIVKTIAAQVIKKNLEGVFKYVEQMLDDGMVSVGETETLTQMVLDALQKANQSMSALAPLFTSLANTVNSSLSSMGSLSEGISGASEESVSILAGYWLSHLNVTTSMAYDVAAIRQAIENRVQANIDNALMSTTEQPINLNEIMYQQLMSLTAIESNTAMNLVKLSQFYDKFSQVVVPNPNGDTAFALKTLN